ncbi:MAG TPA: hybrid sensor histidine kinase/response regulator [Gemmatirosa sp.]|nr:hybrid sensor histidine kinase/response regulator [Gemmatirosa sp.]
MSPSRSRGDGPLGEQERPGEQERQIARGVDGRRAEDRGDLAGAPPDADGGEPVSILLVDDRAENLLALEAILEPLGQRLVRAQSGEEALRRLLAQDFALILLDVQMPGMNGFETARLIKARERSRAIPIIFLTAINKEDAYVFQGYEAGAVDYLFKPFDPDVLRAKVSVFVELHHKREQLRRQERALREGEKRALELTMRAELLEQEARSAERLEAINRELAERSRALEDAMTSRSRFYASMSHELRTPINAIIGYATLLLDGIYGPLADQQTMGVERTHRAAKHLLELVNDVLDLSKIEAGKFDLAVQRTTFPGLVEDLFVTVRPLADDHGCTLSLAHEGPSLTLETDPRRVRQILLNLLSNAIKFGAGQPIEVTLAPHGEGGIVVAVRDHGLGISPTDLPRVFDEFVQLDRGNGAPEAATGTGLGLPISKRLATLLGGELVAESTPGEGSTFRLILPATAPARRDGTGYGVPSHGTLPLAPLPAAETNGAGGSPSGEGEGTPRSTGRSGLHAGAQPVAGSAG